MSSLNLNPKEPGKQYWKSLDEMAETPQFRQFLEREFPEGASELNPINRRQFLQVMGASMAFAGLTGCDTLRRPEQRILPYNNSPENLVPGIPQFYATSMALGEEVVGLLVESHEGRPTKIEGNPKHSASLGAVGKIQQASVLDLYDPDRSKVPLKASNTASWNEFWAEAEILFAKHKATGGEGLRFLSGYLTSPSLADLKNRMLQALPKAKWTIYESVSQDNGRDGLFAAMGRRVNVQYRLNKAKRILSIDCDFLEAEINHLPNAKGFSQLRNPDLGLEDMNRLYVVESRYSITGGAADHRLRAKPGEIAKTFALLVRELRKLGLPLPSEYASYVDALSGTDVSGATSEWIAAACTDLLSARGESLVCVGRNQDPALHALAHAVNEALGNVGKTLEYLPAITYEFNGDAISIGQLVTEMASGAVDTLVILDANPVYSAPADHEFSAALGKVAHSIHMGYEVDETATACAWHLPQSHYLEQWCDAIAFDGIGSIVQPLIAPLYETLAASEFLARLAGTQYTKSYDIVREYWKAKVGLANFEWTWRRWLHDGIMDAAIPVVVSTKTESSPPNLGALLQQHSGAIAALKSEGIEILFREHSNFHDGRYANNAWLQELPDPITKLTWDNAALISPSLAQKLGLKSALLNKESTGTKLGEENKPMVKVSFGGRSLEIPAWVLPGLSDNTVLIHLGCGRQSVGRIGKGAGFNGYGLWTTSAKDFGVGATVEKIGRDYPMACTQDHWSIEGRPHVREGDLQTYLRQKDFASDENMNPHPPLKSLWEPHDYSKGMQWGMVIDFNSCTGCNDCVVACQAENNIPVVGKKQVIMGREMQWIRLDRYFSGDVENPELVFQAMACQHCENAPCEAVCPVAATIHSSEGLNDMVYNRCIGTRYCSNNCPFKVRRFNFFNYTNNYEETEKMQKNPDVTVRFRGVMEKCTYCVQRINKARIEVKNRGEERIPDGMVVPACAQACPSEAIVFGDINNPESRVSKLRSHPRNYSVLAELNIKPRTTYLAGVRNPNPAIAKKVA